MVRIGPLTDEQRQALERVRRRAVGRVSQRAHMVLLNARGYTVEQLAEIFGVGEDVVRKWLHRYEREGPLGLDDRPRPGRPPKGRLARHIVDAQASNPPCNNGLVQGCWTVGLLAAFLATRFRLVLSPASVRRYLHRAGWRGARPRLAPATQAPCGQRQEDPAAPLKLALIDQAVASAATLLYLDECDLHLLPVIRACWMKGPRVRVPTPGQNAKRALFGALDARTGQLHHLVRPRKRAVQFVEFLETLAAAYPVGEVVLVLDNVITQDAKLVRAWLARPEHARFRFLWLPKYSAHEHNPIERVWGLMKDAVAANRLHGSIDLLVEEADRFFASSTFQAPHPLPATPNPLADAVDQAA
ncbi:MAG TPA: IS630 family transposase [Chloroflexota bacterium]|nr:IS630 family transposase [Chloroflexota bacterium]